MALTSSLAGITLDEGPVKGKYDYALLPTVPPGATSRPSNGVEAASILSGDNLVVADYSDNKDLAFQFVKMITDKEAQLDYYEKFGNLPVNAEAPRRWSRTRSWRWSWRRRTSRWRPRSAAPGVTFSWR